MLSHLIEQLVGRHRVGREHEHKELRLVATLGEWSELSVGGVAGRVGRQAHRPQHAASVLRATINLATLVELLHHRRCCGSDIGLGIALKHLPEGFLEHLGVALGNIGQGVDKHKLGHNLRQRIGAHHVGIGLMHDGVVVVKIGSIGLVVEFFLHQIHALEVLQVVGILHRHAIFRLGEVAQNQLPVTLGVAILPAALVEQVHIIISVETIGVVGVTLKQSLKLVGSSRQVLKFVLEDYTHVVEALLNHVVRGLYFLLGLGNLLEVVFLVVRVLGALQGFFINLC